MLCKIFHQISSVFVVLIMYQILKKHKITFQQQVPKYSLLVALFLTQLNKKNEYLITIDISNTLFYLCTLDKSSSSHHQIIHNDYMMPSWITFKETKTKCFLSLVYK